MDKEAMIKRQRIEKWHELLAEWSVCHRAIARGQGNKTMGEREEVLRIKLQDFADLALEAHIA